MRKNTFDLTRLIISGIMVTLAVANAHVIAQDEPPPIRTLAGVWEVTITPYNCTTGAPLPGREVMEVWAFHRDGTMSSTIPPVTSCPTCTPVSRTSAFGLWARGVGWDEYFYKFVHLRYDVATLAFVGRQENKGSVSLSPNGDEITKDNQIPGACNTVVGTRVRLEP